MPLSIISGLLLLVAAALALLAGYLIVLTVAAVFARKRGPAAGPATRRFAVLVPAHNEQALIGRLLTSLNQLDYPKDRVDICVVADNCTDATAVIARSLGARVYERSDAVEQAKGFALRWLLAQHEFQHFVSEFLGNRVHCIVLLALEHHGFSLWEGTRKARDGEL